MRFSKLVQLVARATSGFEKKDITFIIPNISPQHWQIMYIYYHNLVGFIDRCIKIIFSFDFHIQFVIHSVPAERLMGQ